MIPSYALPGRESTPGRHTAMLVALSLIFTLACGTTTPAPSQPAPATRELIAQAEAAESQRRYDQARALYQQAKNQAPDAHSRAAASRAYGRALIFWGEHPLARDELAEAAKLDPHDAGTWHDLAMVRHHLGDVTGAETAFRRSIAEKPEDARSRIALAALLWRHGRLADALREYRALRRIALPEPVRAKVEWAIDVLQKRTAPPP